MMVARRPLPINVPVDWNEIRCRIYEDISRRFSDLMTGRLSSTIQMINVFSEEWVRSGHVETQFAENLVKDIGIGDVVAHTNNPDYLSNMDKLIRDLHRHHRIYVDAKPVYWCESCKTALSSKEIERKKTKKNYFYGKVEIDKNVYFILKDAKEKFENAIGIILDPNGSYVIYNFRGKKIICEEREWEEIRKKLGIGEGEVWSKITYSQILGMAKKIKIFGVENMKTQAFAPNVNRRHYELATRFRIPVKVIPVDTLPAGKMESFKYICRYCGNEVTIKKVPEVYISAKGLTKPEWMYEKHYEDVMISSNIEILPRMPLLYCEKCGAFDYGTKEKKCKCGGKMRKKFSYAENIIMFSSLRTGGVDVLFLTYPDIIWYSYPAYLAMKGIGEEWFSEIKMVRRAKFKDMEDFYFKYGTDVVRLALIGGRGKITEASLIHARRLLNIIENIFRYYEIYQTSREIVENTDRWIISRLEKVKRDLVDLVVKNEYTTAYKIFYNFVVNDLSKFYIRVIRGDKGSLEQILPDVARMLYLFAPRKGRELVEKLHVQLSGFEIREDLINEDLEKEINALKDLISKIYRLRLERNIPLRRPLMRVVVVGTDEQIEKIRKYRDVVMKLCNVMDVEVTTEWGEMYMDIIPNMEAFSEDYRPWATKIAILLRTRDLRRVRKEIEKGEYIVGIEGQEIRITPNMVKFIPRVPEGYVPLSSEFGDVYVDIKSDELVEREHVVREIIRRIQSMKKDIEVDYRDVIDVYIECPPDFRAMIEERLPHILKKVRARKIEFPRRVDVGYVVEWALLDKEVTIGIVPLYRDRVITAYMQIPGVTEDIANRIFDVGVGSVYELMNTDPDELGAIEGLSRALARRIVEYLRRNSPFGRIEKDGKLYCPLCESEISEEDVHCPYCGVLLSERREERKVKEILVEELTLEPGKSYVLLDKFEIGYHKLAEFAQKGEKVLCITQIKPDEVKSKYNLDKNVKITWLSNTGVKGSVRPRDLERLSLIVDGFLAEGGKVIFIDGVEFLISQNDFFAVLRFLQILRDEVKVEKGLLIFPIASKNLSEARLRLLRKEFNVI